MGIFNWYRTGTISITSGATALTGILTSWTNQVNPGDGISFDNGNTWYEASTVNSNTSITLGSAYAGSTLTSATYTIDRRSRAWNDTTSAYALASYIVASLTTVFRISGQPGNTIGADGSLSIDPATKTFYTKTAGAWDNGASLAGTPGSQGTSATVGVASVSRLAAGQMPTVVNAGNKRRASFAFGIPEGQPGKTATVQIGTVATGAAGTSVIITNTGNTRRAVFNFTIPKGDPGTFTVATTAEALAGVRDDVGMSPLKSKSVYNPLYHSTLGGI